MISEIQHLEFAKNLADIRTALASSMKRYRTKTERHHSAEERAEHYLDELRNQLDNLYVADACRAGSPPGSPPYYGQLFENSEKGKIFW